MQVVGVQWKNGVVKASILIHGKPVVHVYKLSCGWCILSALDPSYL
jgi:hypothetical protein